MRVASSNVVIFHCVIYISFTTQYFYKNKTIEITFSLGSVTARILRNWERKKSFLIVAERCIFRYVPQNVKKHITHPWLLGQVAAPCLRLKALNEAAGVSVSAGRNVCYWSRASRGSRHSIRDIGAPVIQG